MCGRHPFKYKKVNLDEIDQQEVLKVEVEEEESEEILLEEKPPQSRKLGVLVYKFPAKSNTFVVNELIALMDQGIDLHIYCLNESSEEDKKLFSNILSRFEGKISYLIKDRLLNWSEFLESEIPLGLNPIRRDWSEELPHNLYSKEIEAVLKSKEPLSILIEDMKRRNVQKLYSPFSNLGAELVMMISTHTNMPFYFTCHSHDLFCMFGYERLKMERATKIFTISEYNKKYILSKYPRNPNDIVVKRVNHLDPAEVQNNDKAHPFIFSAGRLIPMKGFRYSISAFKKLSKRYPELHYYIAGSGIEEENLMTYICELGMQDKIHLVGHISNNEILSYIHSCEFTVLTSIVSEDGDIEGIPTFFIESMNRGVPCIGTNYSGIPELIENGKTGYLTKMKNVNDIYRKMEKLYKKVNSKERGIIYKNCKTKILKDFNNLKNTRVFISELGKI